MIRIQSKPGALRAAVRGVGLLAAALLQPLPALAAPDSVPGVAAAAGQNDEGPPPSDQEIAEGLFRATAKLSAPKPRPTCGEPDKNGDIVVCGANRGEQWRVPSATLSDPTSREALRTGLARAPNVSSLADCSRGCIGIGKAPQPIYVVDLAKLPKAPAGSDADLISKGEMPAP